MNSITLGGVEYERSFALPFPGTLCKHEGCDAPAMAGFGEFCGFEHWKAAADAVVTILRDPEAKKELRAATRKSAHEAIIAIDRTRLERLSANNTATAFADVMEAFFQIQVTNGQIRAINYEKGMTRPRSDRSPKWIQVTDSDFLADVCTAAKRCLSPRLYAYFDLVWLQGRYSTLPGDVFKQLQRQLGRMFRHRQIWPLHIYRRGKFVGTHTEIKNDE